MGAAPAHTGGPKAPARTAGLTALDGPELVFGLVGAVGCDLDSVSSSLRRSLEQAGYTPHVVRVSRLLHQLDAYDNLQAMTGSEYVRIREHMRAGTNLRSRTGRGDVMAWLTVAAIRGLRAECNGDTEHDDPSKIPLGRAAFIVHSIKHPAEIRTLRDVYGRAFFLIAAHMPRDTRVEQLASTIADSEGSTDAASYRHQAEELIQIDEQEDGELGQSVRESFPLADVFIDGSSTQSIRGGIDRFIDGVFGDPFITPTRDEFGMYHAYAASLRSADLGRQVGAAIASPAGDILCVGCNDVPKAGGGLYWTGDAPDHRDFREGYDSSEKFKRSIAVQLAEKLRAAGWIAPETPPPHENIADFLADRHGPLRGTSILGLLEFGRAVHAEMAAIVHAANRGIGVQGATLFSTTFPCHLCARHIVASGIARVVYIEPYPKSQAEELYRDSLTVDPKVVPADRVCFQAFVGVSPAQYMWMFRNDERKAERGRAVEWNRAGANPKLKRFVTSYMLIEDQVIGTLLPSALNAAGISTVG